MPPSPSTHPAQPTPKGPEARPRRRKRLFVLLSRTSASPSEHFRLPEKRILSVGGNIDL